MKRLMLAFLILGLSSWVKAQNVAITDDGSYTANTSAMLDVKSITKGMLVPRLTSLQRAAIASPATGLLVFDTDFVAFFFYNGISWVNLTTPVSNIWSTNTSGVYLANTLSNLGLGTTYANGKLEIQGDSPAGTDELLLAVKNAKGDTVFAVYSGGVRIYVDDTPMKGTGSRGGFAVGGFSTGKGGLTNEYLRITPDSIRLYVDDNPQLKATGSRGGFAVGGYSTGKSFTNEYLRVSPDSVRIYVDPNSKATGSRGGFAVGGFSTGKSNPSDFLQMTKDNYFIGLGAGSNNNTGLYNSFMGYQAGNKNQYGDQNIFLGYEAGFSNIGGTPASADSLKGDRNVFLGYKAGRSNTYGYDNVFLGNQSGRFNSVGNNNIFIGINSGYSMTTGIHNTLIGSSAGFSQTNQSYNVMIGTAAGYHINASGWSGSFNTFVGINAGYAIQNSRDNTFIGTNAGYWLEHGEGNTFLGIDAGRSGSEHHLGYTANYNTFLGNKSGYNNYTGSNNVAVGYYSGYNNNTGSGNVFLGYLAGYSETGSNKLVIENSNAGQSTALIYGEFDTDKLQINAKMGIGTAPDASATLKVNGNAIFTGVINSNTLAATSISGNLTGNVTGDVAGKVNNVTMGKVFLAADGDIVQLDAGKIILYWDKGHERITLINDSHDLCSFWYTTHRDNIIEGNSGFVEMGTQIDLFSVPKAYAVSGFEVHFGTGLIGSDYCSVWLQYIQGNLVGHFLK